jgi:pyruvate dehydrogenase (quinone)/pyruvate oxidase
VAFVGDGGFSMLMGEFANCANTACRSSRHRQEHSLGDDQVGTDGVPRQSEYGASCSPSTLPRCARACGATGFSVADPKQCGGVLEQAFATHGPVIVEATVDPFEPPMPP